MGSRPFGFSVVRHTPGESLHLRYRPYLGMYLLTGVGAVFVGLLALVLFVALGTRETWAVVALGGASIFWGVMAYYLLLGARADLRFHSDEVRFKLKRSHRLPCSAVCGVRGVARRGNEANGPDYVLVELRLEAERGAGAELKPYLAEVQDDDDHVGRYYVVLRFPCRDQEDAQQLAGALDRALTEVWETARAE